MTSNADLQKIAERLLVDPRAKVQRDKTQGNTEGKDLKMEEVLQSEGTSDGCRINEDKSGIRL